MSGITRLVNKLIPFADASRPIWQDAIYSLIICTFLYFAPQLSFTTIWQSIRGQAGLSRPNQPAQIIQGEIQPGESFHENNAAGQQPTQQIRPPAPTVEDDTSSGSDDDDSLNDEDLVAMIRDAERQGALADPFAPGPAAARGAHVVEQLQPPLLATQQQQQQPRRLRDPNRQVGAKKAKSLARRERIRAYHEFMREQGDMQRAQEASTAAERDKEIAEARARRAKVEAEIEDKARRRREEKRVAEEERERREREAVRAVLEMVAAGLAREGRVEVRAVADAVRRDVEWVTHLVRKEGVLDVKNTSDGRFVVLLTSKGWIVKVSEDDVRQLQAQASTYQGKVAGKVSWSEMGSILDNILRKQHRVH